jgi:hypothetical protein
VQLGGIERRFYYSRLDVYNDPTGRVPTARLLVSKNDLIRPPEFGDRAFQNAAGQFVVPFVEYQVELILAEE